VGSGTNAGIEAMFAPGVHLEFENPFTWSHKIYFWLKIYSGRLSSARRQMMKSLNFYVCTVYTQEILGGSEPIAVQMPFYDSGLHLSQCGWKFVSNQNTDHPLSNLQS
jgi:hypothetical protein